MKRWRIVLGILLILLGVFNLIELFFQFNPWRYLFPLLLVAWGVRLILRPRITGRDRIVETPLLGDVRKVGVWNVTNHEIWMLAGSTRLDFSDAFFPEGDATFRIIGFAAEAEVILPEHIGLAIESAAIISELNGFEGKQERILTGLNYQTPGFDQAEKRVTLETFSFVSEIKLKRPLM